VSDDKKKEADGKADDGKKKKGWPAVVMVAVGAAIGGAGVVFLVPPKTVEVQAPVVVLVDEQVEHPDKMEFRFNPRAEAGKAYANISFTFEYSVREDKKDAAFEAIKHGWGRARSNVIELLCGMTAKELQSPSGKRILAKSLIETLDATLFPEDGHEKVATVNLINWGDYMFQ
jgi:flagellar basal body-associated protein FliL